MSFSWGQGYNLSDDDDIAVRGIGVQRGLEVYSGDVNGQFLGEDTTPERLTQNGDPEWSIMMRGTADDQSGEQNPTSRFAFSIEELLTVDFKHVPSRGKE